MILSLHLIQAKFMPTFKADKIKRFHKRQLKMRQLLQIVSFCRNIYEGIIVQRPLSIFCSVVINNEISNRPTMLSLATIDTF
ncbi:hypothetical protein [Virgibacillus pantothenticus]|uniref:hypothetical protein n=1 Tax=Virgibacillus pantothenticus TaxID=1473 RepID=UPI001BAF97D6|nr:hypothetical protein [Virgibacillus pantothenticus]